MNALHIVQGGVDNNDKAWLEKAAHRKWSTEWTVPKSAKVGDEVVIFVLGYGFFATAKVTSLPEPCGENRPKRYCAGLTSIRLIEPAISLAAIERELPELTWAKYPRSYTTPPTLIAKRIRTLIAYRRKTGLPRLDDEALEEANHDELRKVALLNARSVVAARKGKTIYRARSLAIRLYVLHRANGRCEGCRAPAPFQKRMARHILNRTTRPSYPMMALIIQRELLAYAQTAIGVLTMPRTQSILMTHLRRNWPAWNQNSVA